LATYRSSPPLTVAKIDIDLAMTIFDRALRDAKDELARRPVA